MLKVGDEIVYFGAKSTVIDVATCKDCPPEYDDYARYVLRLHDKKDWYDYKIDERDSGEYIYADTYSVDHSNELLNDEN